MADRDRNATLLSDTGGPVEPARPNRWAPRAVLQEMHGCRPVPSGFRPTPGCSQSTLPHRRCRYGAALVSAVEFTQAGFGRSVAARL